MFALFYSTQTHHWTHKFLQRYVLASYLNCFFATSSLCFTKKISGLAFGVALCIKIAGFALCRGQSWGSSFTQDTIIFFFKTDRMFYIFKDHRCLLHNLPQIINKFLVSDKEILK